MTKFNEYFIALEEAAKEHNIPLSNEDIFKLSGTMSSKVKKSNEYYANEFNRIFNVPKEEEPKIPSLYKHNVLRVSIILEELIELAYVIGVSKSDIYNIFEQKVSKNYKYRHVKNSNMTEDDRIVAIHDALGDILVTTYGTYHIMDCKEGISNLIMEEIYKSNISKVIENIENLSFYVDKAKKDYNTEVISVRLTDSNNNTVGYCLQNKDTGKILKPRCFKEPDIKSILENNNIL